MCSEREQLAKEVTECLEEIKRLTDKQLEVLTTNANFFNELDRKLEQVIGEKERKLGGLRQHEKEHGCI